MSDVVLTFLNIILLVMMAPLWVGLVNNFSAILTGGKLFPVLGNWKDIAYQIRRPASIEAGRSFYLFAGFALLLVTSAAIPFFVIPSARDGGGNIVAVGILLVVSQLMLNLASSLSISDTIYGSVLIFSFMSLDLLTQSQSISSFLLHHQLPSLVPLPFLLVSAAFFSIAFFASSGHKRIHGLSGLSLGVGRWSYDCLSFFWIVLACDFLWPSSLAVPFGFLQGDQWFMGCLKGLLAALIKFIISAAFMAMFRVFFVVQSHKKLHGCALTALLCVLALCARKLS